MNSYKTSKILKIFLFIILKIQIVSIVAQEIDKDLRGDTKLERFCRIHFKESLNYCASNPDQCWSKDTKCLYSLPPQMKGCSSARTSTNNNGASENSVTVTNPSGSASVQVNYLYTHLRAVISSTTMLNSHKKWVSATLKIDILILTLEACSFLLSRPIRPFYSSSEQIFQILSQNYSYLVF